MEDVPAPARIRGVLPHLLPVAAASRVQGPGGSPLAVTAGQRVGNGVVEQVEAARAGRDEVGAAAVGDKQTLDLLST